MSLLLDHEPRLGALRVNADGLCEPNPGGIATYGFVVVGPTGTELRREGGVVARGERATVNVAEYGAVLRALRWLVGEGGRRTGAKLESLLVLSDSQLLVRQLSGEYAVRSARLLPLFEEARLLMGRFGESRAVWIPREENELADSLSVAAYVEAMEEPRAARADEVVLEPVGSYGLFLANGRWRTDAALGLCDCPDFKRHNTKRFRIRCKHLFKALRLWSGPTLLSEPHRAGA
jgi:ribonuclease HI